MAFISSYAFSTRGVEYAGIDIPSCTNCGACLSSIYNVGLVEDSGEEFAVWVNESARVLDMSFYNYPAEGDKANILGIEGVCPNNAIFHHW